MNKTRTEYMLSMRDNRRSIYLTTNTYSKTEAQFWFMKYSIMFPNSDVSIRTIILNDEE